MDWLGAALAILKAVKKETLHVDPKYIVIKPRVLSDQNILRGAVALRAVLAFIPPAAVAAPVLGLGEVGFNLWKRIALGKEFDHLKYPPITPNVLRLSIELDPELHSRYGHLTLGHNWNEESIQEVEKVYNDLSYITDVEMLKAKYPSFPVDYLQSRADKNKQILQKNITTLEQELEKVSLVPEVDQNIREALEFVKNIFPTMNDWALFNSEAFDEFIELIDTIV